MDIQTILEHQLAKILGGIKQPNATANDIDTCSALYNLASKPKWTPTELEQVDFLSKRLDISKKLFHAYQHNGRKATNTVLTNPIWLELVMALLLKAIFLTPATKPEKKLKQFNVLFKALELLQPEWLSDNTEISNAKELTWNTLLANLPTTPEKLIVTNTPTPAASHLKEPKVIPLTILYYEGPIARAYLETIRYLGFKPQKIIELIASKDIVTQKTVGRLLPRSIRKFYAATIQYNKTHYWPRNIKKSHAEFVDAIINTVDSTLGISKRFVNNANKFLPLSDYSHNIESLLIDGLSDKTLHQHLMKQEKSTVLFTGGGIMPSSLLSIQGLKFLHIHPGFLPNIRGADCALWSSLITGHVSASCFFMSPGIDTGNIILPCWLPKLSFDIDTKNIDLQTRYRAVYGFLDPWLRSFVLREVLNSHDNFHALPSVSQTGAGGSGATFHFMHDKLRELALTKLFA